MGRNCQNVGEPSTQTWKGNYKTDKHANTFNMSFEWSSLSNQSESQSERSLMVQCHTPARNTPAHPENIYNTIVSFFYIYTKFIIYRMILI